METEKLIRLAVGAIAGAVAGLVLYRLISAITAKKAEPKPYSPRKKGKLIRLPVHGAGGIGGLH